MTQTATWQSHCLTLLAAMNAGSGNEWTAGHTQLYEIVLTAIGEGHARRAVQWAVLNEEWRPSPAKLRQIAARLAAPYPDAELCYAEIWTKAARIGLYGKQHPDRPNIRLAGPPDFTHPVIRQIIGCLGGWEAICTGEAQMQEGLKKQVRAAHASVSERWEREVSRQLTLPPAERDMRYFAPYEPYAVPDGWSDEPAEIPAPPDTSIRMIDAPAELREAAAILADKFTMP